MVMLARIVTLFLVVAVFGPVVAHAGPEQIQKAEAVLNVGFLYREDSDRRAFSEFWFKLNGKILEKHIVVSKDAMEAADYRTESVEEGGYRCGSPNYSCWGFVLVHEGRVLGRSGLASTGENIVIMSIPVKGKEGLDMFEDVIRIAKKEIAAKRAGLAEAERLPNATLSEAAIKIREVSALSAVISRLEKDVADAEAYHAELRASLQMGSSGGGS